jgi:hypothetical protein
LMEWPGSFGGIMNEAPIRLFMCIHMKVCEQPSIVRN